MNSRMAVAHSCGCSNWRKCVVSGKEVVVNSQHTITVFSPAASRRQKAARPSAPGEPARHTYNGYQLSGRIAIPFCSHDALLSGADVTPASAFRECVPPRFLEQRKLYHARSACREQSVFESDPAMGIQTARSTGLPDGFLSGRWGGISDAGTNGTLTPLENGEAPKRCRVRSQKRGNGRAYGIRTRDLHLERVMS